MTFDSFRRSLTFTGLIPGKTYNFAVYTVYQGVRSRPVTANITTCTLSVDANPIYQCISYSLSDPSKVSKLYPVMGRDYVILYWEAENITDNECRYRLRLDSLDSRAHLLTFNPKNLATRARRTQAIRALQR